jgi:hypothetical protein
MGHFGTRLRFEMWGISGHFPSLKPSKSLIFSINIPAPQLQVPRGRLGGVACVTPI